MYMRNQATKELEKNSVHNDVVEIYLRSAENHDTLFDIYEETLSLREEISARELFERALSCKSLDDAERLAREYPLPGVCAIEIDSDPGSYQSISCAAADDYCIVFRGEYIASCGDGVIVRPCEIINIYSKV